MTDREKLDIFLKDFIADEDTIKLLAKRVLPADWVDGDSYSVPGIVDIVEELVKTIEDLKNNEAFEYLKSLRANTNLPEKLS